MCCGYIAGVICGRMRLMHVSYTEFDFFLYKCRCHTVTLMLAYVSYPDFDFASTYSAGDIHTLSCWPVQCRCHMETFILLCTVQVLVPGAKRVAVKAGDEWTHLKDQGGNLWEGDVSLQQYRNKNVTVNLNACTGDDETQFATLLQYTV